MLLYSGDVNGGHNGNDISRGSPLVCMITEAVSFSGPWLSSGTVVLNLLFWIHPTLNLKWWISLDFKSSTLYSINKYSFFFSLSSSIFSSIMAEVTAVKALYPLLFITTRSYASSWNYEINKNWVWTRCVLWFIIVIRSVFIPRIKPCRCFCVAVFFLFFPLHFPLERI